MTAEQLATIADETEERTPLPEGWRPLTIDPLEEGAPEGWRWETLKNLARLESGHTPSRYHPEWWGGDIPWVALPDIRNLDGKTACETSEYTNELGIANSSARILPTGTVCLSRTASVGFVTVMGRPMATSQDFVNWVCGEQLNPYFLSFILQASRDYLLSLATGAVHKTIYVPTVKEFRICLPDLPEQKRIAAVLDEQIKAIEQARRAVEEQHEAAKLLPGACLRSVFDSEEAQSWQKRKLGEIAKVQSGYAFKTEWYVDDGIRLLRNANVFQGFIDWSDVATLSLEARPKFESYELNEGDIVLSLDRPLVSNGLKVAKLTSQDVPSLLLQRVGRFQLRGGIDSEFLYLFLNSDIFISSIKGYDQSLGVPHISPTQVEKRRNLRAAYRRTKKDRQKAERAVAGS